MKKTLVPGIEHEFEFPVTDAQTVPALFPDARELKVMPTVLATAYLIGLFEWTCIQALLPHLEWPGEQTVGTRIDIDHIAATPVGFKVRLKARLVEVDRRRLLFEVEAHDGVDTISRGRHERFVIDKTGFDAKLKEKSAKG